MWLVPNITTGCRAMSVGPLALVGRPLRRFWGGFGMATIPIVLAAVTIVLGLVSWTAYVLSPAFVEAHKNDHISHDTLHSVAVILFRTLGAFVPSVWNINEGTRLTDAAAILGLATFYSSVALIAADRFAETLRKLAARFLYRGHVIVIGGTGVAQRAHVLWARRRRVLHILDRGATVPREGRNWVKAPLDQSIIERFALDRASSVFLDLGEDMSTLALALELLPGSRQRQRRAAADGTGGDEWTVVVRDKTLADQFALKLKQLGEAGVWLPHIHYFCPPRAVVRDVLAEHPLFLEGHQSGPIHAVIVGFGSAGSHLVDAIFLTSLLADRPPPRVTIVSPRKEADRAIFLSGRSALADELDVEFVDITAIDDFEGNGPPARLLRAREAATPATAVFLLADSFNENVRLAVKVKYIQRKTGRLIGNLFALEDSNEPGAACRMSRAFAHTIDGFIAFGLRDERLELQFCDPERRDLLARGLHANYLETAGLSGPTWSELSESLRRANCNAADHALAKLHSLGFDIAGLPGGVIPSLHDQDVRDIREALRAATGSSPGLVSDIIRLEHERWSIERRLNGWTYGERKDVARQTHPFLVDWSELCARHPDEKLKDKGQIEALINCLVRYGAPRFTLKRDPRPLGGVVADQTVEAVQRA